MVTGLCLCWHLPARGRETWRSFSCQERCQSLSPKQSRAGCRQGGDAEALDWTVTSCQKRVEGEDGAVRRHQAVPVRAQWGCSLTWWCRLSSTLVFARGPWQYLRFQEGTANPRPFSGCSSVCEERTWAVKMHSGPSTGHVCRPGGACCCREGLRGRTRRTDTASPLRERDSPVRGALPTRRCWPSSREQPTDPVRAARPGEGGWRGQSPAGWAVPWGMFPISGVSTSRSCLRCSGKHEVPPGNLGFPSTEPLVMNFPLFQRKQRLLRGFLGILCTPPHSILPWGPRAAIWDGVYDRWGWEDTTAARK